MKTSARLAYDLIISTLSRESRGLSGPDYGDLLEELEREIQARIEAHKQSGVDHEI